ncbi:MAG: alpha/beta hydrolase [Chloroflexota bacterium]
MKMSRVSFSSGGLVLEGILAIPEGAGPFPAVIVCHPHSLYGGSMDNNVVNSLSETLTQTMLVSFKFNFRGVCGSQGEFGQGIGEQDDVEAAISFINTVKAVDSERMGLAGYSAGTGFAFPVGFNDDRIRAMAAISPPLPMFDFNFLKACPKPKLLISGSRDELISIDQFLEFCQNLPEPKECESIEGADHFWWGYESRLAAKVTAFFTKVL